MANAQVVQFVSIMPYLVVLSESTVEPFIVGGESGKIEEFSYAAFLGTRCMDNKGMKLKSWICGSSIVNQHLTLTAGHCVFGCSEFTSITISVGHEDLLKGSVSTAHSFLIHESYCDLTFTNDIALVRLRTPLKLGAKISRVALMENPPYSEEAIVAGWGVIDEARETETRVLRFIKQYVWDKKICFDLLEWIPEGTFCASSKNPSSFASDGDSGSALIAEGYIQLGFVSSKNPKLSMDVAVYTDIGYFYNWIKINSKELVCQ